MNGIFCVFVFRVLAWWLFVHRDSSLREHINHPSIRWSPNTDWWHIHAHLSKSSPSFQCDVYMYTIKLNINWLCDPFVRVAVHCVQLAVWRSMRYTFYIVCDTHHEFGLFLLAINSLARPLFLFASLLLLLLLLSILPVLAIQSELSIFACVLFNLEVLHTWFST